MSTYALELDVPWSVRLKLEAYAGGGEGAGGMSGIGGGGDGGGGEETASELDPTTARIPYDVESRVVTQRPRGPRWRRIVCRLDSCLLFGRILPGLID